MRAGVIHLKNLLLAVEALLNERVVHAHLPELVLNHGHFEPVVAREDVVEQCRLPRAQKACEDRDRHLCLGSRCHRGGRRQQQRQRQRKQRKLCAELKKRRSPLAARSAAAQRDRALVAALCDTSASAALLPSRCFADTPALHRRLRLPVLPACSWSTRTQTHTRREVFKGGQALVLVNTSSLVRVLKEPALASV